MNVITQSSWSTTEGTDATFFRRLMSNVAIMTIRKVHYQLFLSLMKPKPRDLVLDVGTTADTTLADSNYFVKQYPYKKNLSICSIEDCSSLVIRYGLKSFSPLRLGESLPYADSQFDIVIAYSVIEHVGTYADQECFVNELFRVGRKVFVVTPDRLSPYEAHTGMFFFHWLKPQIFRRLAYLFGKRFWSSELHLNILSLRDMIRLGKKTGMMHGRVRLCGIIPLHLFLAKI